jgi:hypothetical protein
MRLRWLKSTASGWFKQNQGGLNYQIIHLKTSSEPVKWQEKRRNSMNHAYLEVIVKNKFGEGNKTLSFNAEKMLKDAEYRKTVEAFILSASDNKEGLVSMLVINRCNGMFLG